MQKGDAVTYDSGARARATKRRIFSIELATCLGVTLAQLRAAVRRANEAVEEQMGGPERLTGLGWNRQGPPRKLTDGRLPERYPGCWTNNEWVKRYQCIQKRIRREMSSTQI